MDPSCALALGLGAHTNMLYPLCKPLSLHLPYRLSTCSPNSVLIRALIVRTERYRTCLCVCLVHSIGWPSAAFLNQNQANGQDAWSGEVCRHPTRTVHDSVQQSCLLNLQATWLIHIGLLPLPMNPDSCRRSCLGPQALAVKYSYGVWIQVSRL